MTVYCIIRTLRKSLRSLWMVFFLFKLPKKNMKIDWDTKISEKSGITHLEVLKTPLFACIILYQNVRTSKGLEMIYDFFHNLQSSNPKLNMKPPLIDYCLLSILFCFRPVLWSTKDIHPLYIPLSMPPTPLVAEMLSQNLKTAVSSVSHKFIHFPH